MRKFVKLVFVLAVLCLFFLAGCSSVQTNNSNGMNNSLKDDSLTKVKERGVLIVGTCAELPPLEFRDDQGKIVGGDIDIANEIASQLGIPRVEFRNYSWDEMLQAAESGTVDFSISSIVMTPARMQKMLFSIPYFDAGQVIVVRKDDTAIAVPQDLKNFKVGAVKETTNEKAALEYADAAKYTGYDSFDQLVLDVKEKKIDAAVIDYVIGVVWVARNSDLKMAGEPFTQQYYGIATKLGNDALMNEINRILRDIKRTGKLDEIKDKWLK